MFLQGTRGRMEVLLSVVLVPLFCCNALWGPHPLLVYLWCLSTADCDVVRNCLRRPESHSTKLSASSWTYVGSCQDPGLEFVDLHLQGKSINPLLSTLYTSTLSSIFQVKNPILVVDLKMDSFIITKRSRIQDP